MRQDAQIPLGRMIYPGSNSKHDSLAKGHFVEKDYELFADGFLRALCYADCTLLCLRLTFMLRQGTLKMGRKLLQNPQPGGCAACPRADR